MTTRGRGRPKTLKLVSIDEAIEIVAERYQNKIRPARQTIYNKISAKVLTNHGTRHCALLDESEVIEKLCS